MRGEGAGLEEQGLVDPFGLALGGGGEQFVGHDHEAAQIALGVIGQGGDHLRGHQRGRAGLVREMPQTSLESFGGGALHRQTDADAAVEGQELVGTQALDETGVAGQDDGQQDVGIELGGGQQAQFGQNRRAASPGPRRR